MTSTGLVRSRATLSKDRILPTFPTATSAALGYSRWWRPNKVCANAHVDGLVRQPASEGARAPRLLAISGSESHRGECQNASERLVMAVDVEHGRLVLVGACGDQEVWDRYTMLTVCRELTLSSQRGRDRLAVDSELMKRVELDLELLVGVR